MTNEERIQAIVDFGFTERQARFLVTVMLHSGVCLLRQYTAFAGVVHGQKTRKFFAKLVKHGYATAYPCRHNRGRVYHVQHKPLYRAIGETESRFRRPMSAALVVDRLTLLDALLASPEVVWLATDDDKRAHVSALAGVSPDEASQLVNQAGRGRARSARDPTPVGVELSGRWVFVYVVTGDQIEDFHRYLQQHADLFAVLPAWTVRVVSPPHLQMLGDRYLEVFTFELTRAQPQLVERLRWYFQQRRGVTIEGASIDDEQRYFEERFCFSAPRFQVLYKRWLSEGDSALDVVSSAATADAIKSGVGRIETHVLPFAYRHLSLLVGKARPTMKGAEKGDDTHASSRPCLVSAIDTTVSRADCAYTASA
ncbi:MAG: hypothetical protein AB7I36_20540 [Rhodospirillaceae bacterium]